jgi:UDP-N-acetylglucosamine 2-epimerase (non-hydrolysing)
MKVMTVVGTRPEVIRLSRVMKCLDESLDHVLVHTGQNWDYRLNGIFFDELVLRPPDHVLNVDTSSLGAVLADTLRKTEEVLRREKPDAFLVLGDTNSAISALMAKRLHVPVYHMEAGNRCFDENVPEEINRRVVDHAADFNLVYTEQARRNLLAEGFHPRRILLTGSPLREVLDHYRSKIEASDVLSRLGVSEQGYFVVSAHREENVDAPTRLTALLDCLRAVRDRWKLPIIVSTHPRTRQRLESLHDHKDLDGIVFSEPFGFHDYNHLQLKAFCVLSDSGSISEESSILRFPAITLRSSIERPEALDAGSIIMTDLRPGSVVAGVDAARTDHLRTSSPHEYLISDCSVRVRNFILSTAYEHAVWSGLR